MWFWWPLLPWPSNSQAPWLHPGDHARALPTPPPPPSCHELHLLPSERRRPLLLPCAARHWDPLQLPSLYDSNNFENEIYSPGSDLSPCQPPIYRSLVRSSSRSPRQREALIFFFPLNLRPTLQTEEANRVVLLPARQVTAKVKHRSGDVKLGKKRADTRLPLR